MFKSTNTSGLWLVDDSGVQFQVHKLRIINHPGSQCSFVMEFLANCYTQSFRSLPGVSFPSNPKDGNDYNILSVMTNMNFSDAGWWPTISGPFIYNGNEYPVCVVIDPPVLCEVIDQRRPFFFQAQGGVDPQPDGPPFYSTGSICRILFFDVGWKIDESGGLIIGPWSQLPLAPVPRTINERDGIANNIYSPHSIYEYVPGCIQFTGKVNLHANDLSKLRPSIQNKGNGLAEVVFPQGFLDFTWERHTAQNGYLWSSPRFDYYTMSQGTLYNPLRGPLSSYNASRPNPDTCTFYGTNPAPVLEDKTVRGCRTRPPYDPKVGFDDDVLTDFWIFEPCDIVGSAVWGNPQALLDPFAVGRIGIVTEEMGSGNVLITPYMASTFYVASLPVPVCETLRTTYNLQSFIAELGNRCSTFGGANAFCKDDRFPSDKNHNAAGYDDGYPMGTWGNRFDRIAWKAYAGSGSSGLCLDQVPPSPRHLAVAFWWQTPLSPQATPKDMVIHNQVTPFTTIDPTTLGIGESIEVDLSAAVLDLVSPPDGHGSGFPCTDPNSPADLGRLESNLFCVAFYPDSDASNPIDWPSPLPQRTSGTDTTLLYYFNLEPDCCAVGFVRIKVK